MAPRPSGHGQGRVFVVTPELAQGSWTLPYAQDLLPVTESSSSGAPPSLPQFPFGKHCCLHGDMAKEVPLSGRRRLDGQSPSCLRASRGRIWDGGPQIQQTGGVGMHLQALIPSLDLEGTTLVTFSLLHVSLLTTPCCVYEEILFFLLDE